MSQYFRLKRSKKYHKYDFRMLRILIKLRIKENGEIIIDIVTLFFNRTNYFQ